MVIRRCGYQISTGDVSAKEADEIRNPVAGYTLGCYSWAVIDFNGRGACPHAGFTFPAGTVRFRERSRGFYLPQRLSGGFRLWKDLWAGGLVSHVPPGLASGWKNLFYSSGRSRARGVDRVAFCRPDDTACQSFS